MATFQTACLVGVVGSTAFTSANFALSLIAVPALLLTTPKSLPDADSAKQIARHHARQWQTIYNLGHRAGPITGIISSASFIYAALQIPPTAAANSWILFLAAVMALGVVPFTLLIMDYVNNELHRRADSRPEPTAASEFKRRIINTDTQGLIQSWAWLGLLRASFTLVSAVCGSKVLYDFMS